MKTYCLVPIVMLLGISAAWGQPAENLVIITYDGLRWQELFGGADERRLAPEAKPDNVEVIREKFWAETPEARREKLLPFFWEVFAKQGQVYGDAEAGSISTVTNGRNFSYPGYNEILTGAPDDRIDSNDKKDNPNVTVLEWFNGQEGFKGKVAAFGSWDVFPYIINANRSGLPVNAGWMDLTESPDPARLAVINEFARETPRVWAGVRFDVFTHNGAVEYIKKHGPRVLYISYGETDDWAHEGRYDLYLESARQTDEYIKRLWELFQSMPQYANKTAIVLTTDHGRGDLADWTGHGKDVVGSERIWFGLLGAGIPAKGIVKNTTTTQGQAAATGVALLGLDYVKANPKAAKPIIP